tara:strand:+ start:18 stop:476 length:459 start_codon:yes stop_codon:yes gene_type:complete
MLQLDDDCISKVYKSYLDNFTICKKNICDLQKFYFSKKIYNVCKNIKINNNCHIINISNINLKLCNMHDNVDMLYLKKLLDGIESFIKTNSVESINNNSINITSKLLNTNNYIHLRGLHIYKDITKLILEKYNLKIKRYCCGGSGCMLEFID